MRQTKAIEERGQPDPYYGRTVRVFGGPEMACGHDGKWRPTQANAEE